MLKVITRKAKTILEKQLKPLEYQGTKDTNRKYLSIYTQTYTQTLKSYKEEELFSNIYN